MNARKTIFLVDDEVINLVIGKNTLSTEYNIYTLNSGATLFNMLKNVKPDLILLDVKMPEMDGYEVLSRIKNNPETAEIPVIFLSASTDEEAELKGLSMGAVDYIFKPFSKPLLLKRLEIHMLIESQKNELKNYSTALKNMFGRYVSGDVVDEMMAGNIGAQLGGVLREISVLFVDIRGFTAFSESSEPETVVEVVNRYFNLTSVAIQRYSGTIDKYIGDSTMAIYNTPSDVKDHAMCAVQTAWDIKQGLVALRKEILRDFGVDLPVGIGINTGPAIVGNMGSDFRMDYTVIGDTVNTAARLEQNALGGQILISEAVYNQVKNRVQVIDKGTIMVKNRREGVHIFEVTDVEVPVQGG